MSEIASDGHLWSFEEHSIRDMIQTGEDGAERNAGEYVWVVSLTWIELLTIHFYHVKRTATRKHTPSLQTDAHWRLRANNDNINPLMPTVVIWVQL